jgi:DNA-binding transcriptional regulator YiaG
VKLKVQNVNNKIKPLRYYKRNGNVRAKLLRRNGARKAMGASHQHGARSNNEKRQGGATMSGAVARKLDSIRTKGAMKHTDVANILGTRPETVSRWNQGRAYPHASTEKTLLELEFIIDQLSDFYEPNEARLWIFSPQKHLSGISPAELIREGRIDEVRRLVNQLRDAVYI